MARYEFIQLLKDGLEVVGLRTLTECEHWSRAKLFQDNEADSAFESSAQKRSSADGSLHSAIPHMMPGLGSGCYQENWKAKVREKLSCVNSSSGIRKAFSGDSLHDVAKAIKL
jgi:hypothetical protein